MTISTLNKIIIMILLKKIIILTVELTIKKTIISTLSLIIMEIATTISTQLMVMKKIIFQKIVKKNLIIKI